MGTGNTGSNTVQDTRGIIYSSPKAGPKGGKIHKIKQAYPAGYSSVYYEHNETYKYFVFSPMKGHQA